MLARMAPVNKSPYRSVWPPAEMTKAPVTGSRSPKSPWNLLLLMMMMMPDIVAVSTPKRMAPRETIRQ